MKKLNAKQLGEKAMLRDRLAAARSALESALEAYKGVLEDAQAFRDQIAADINNWWDLRSEKWQESEAGQAYSEFKDAWEQELEIEVEIDDEGVLDAFDELPEEVAL